MCCHRHYEAQLEHLFATLLPGCFLEETPNSLRHFYVQLTRAHPCLLPHPSIPVMVRAVTFQGM